MAGLDPAIHVFLAWCEEGRECPGHLARRRASRFCPGMTSFEIDSVSQGTPMSANNTLHIAVLGGDGIGPEVMAPALEVLRKIEATSDLKFGFTDAAAAAPPSAPAG